MNIKEYRRRAEARIKGSKAIARDPTGKRIRDKLADKSSAWASRVEAIDKAPIEPDNIEHMAPLYLRTLSSGSDKVAVRMAALDALQAADFLGPVFDPYQVEYLQVLRKVATDPSPSLRKNALEILAIEKDPYAQEVLLRGLMDPKQALVPLDKAIQLLGYDDHANVIKSVRKLFANADNSVQEEALRLFASDPDSEGLLLRLLQDKSQRTMIRQMSAAALRTLNAEVFEKVAKQIVVDDGDYNEIRAACLAALTASGKAASDKDFVKQVAKLKTRSGKLRASVRRFLRRSRN